MKEIISIDTFIEKIKSGEAKVLTVEAARALRGKKIIWTYFGYESNTNVVETMVVGDITTDLAYNETQPMVGYKSRAEYWRSYMTPNKLKECAEKLILLNSDGKYTYIFSIDGKTFTCSDSDREVYYLC